MLDIYIYDDAPETAGKIKSVCFSYLLNTNIDADVRVLDAFPGELPESACLYFLSCNDSLSEQAGSIHITNPANYIIVTIKDFSELGTAVNPAVRPSGLLQKPPEDERVNELLKQVYSDYLRCVSENDAVFAFKVKAKNYAVPYSKILFFESREKRIILKTDVQEFTFYETLDNILKAAPESFMRIHKSFAVNTERISSVDYKENTVALDDGSVVFTSRTFKKELKERILMKAGDAS